MKKDFVEGLTVDVKNTAGGWSHRAGKILAYKGEAFYSVMIYGGKPDLIVHEDDMRPAHPLTLDRHPARRL